MSVKRFALFAALSQHNNNHQNNPNTTTTTMTMTTLKSPLQQQLLQKSSTTAPSTLTVGTIDSSSSRSSNNNNNTTSSIMTTGSAITTYYSGGLGLFHQQNIRANSGVVGGGGGSGIGIGGGGLGLMNSGSGNGAGSNNFPNAINGNVNLLLGGAMLSLVTTILCVVCYCCHRNIKKRTEAAYRQQRQWLENDPNMEIYSVEQCYETSGLFLGESNDGLATLPALHHEPPPSYDAVVAMQEQQLLQQQQQQQQLMLLELEHHHHHQLQSNSPPPGYRSSLDVSAATATMVGATMVAGCSRGAPDGMAISDSNGNLNGQQKTLNGVSTMMNMKNVLSAQSCCSLQRAEVENMWNAAAAAVAARAAHTNAVASATSQEQVATSAMRTPTTIMKRKTLPAYAGAKLSVNEFGRRYLNQNYYRRGCPLCGKFCYNDEGENEGALSLSTESLRLDNLATPTTTELATVAGRSTNNNMLTRQFCRRNDCDNNGNDGDFEDVESREMTQTHIDDNRRNHNSETNRVGNSPKATASSFNVGNSPANYDYDDDENDSKTCTCISNRRDTSRTQCETIPTGASNRYNTQEQQLPDDNANDKNDDENGNDHLVPAQQLGLVASLSENEMSDFVANFDGNEAILPITDADNNNVNPTISATSTSISEDTDITPTTSTLDSINENGIIRLDMSKIIDRTGLPNYEAALKLESSGYV